MKQLTKDQEIELQKAAEPLMKWLHEHTHPHFTVIVDSEHLQLIEGVTTVIRRKVTELSQPIIPT